MDAAALLTFRSPVSGNGRVTTWQEFPPLRVSGLPPNFCG
jgi:hypothetical protein